MKEENIIKLTSALYKVTGLFPKGEPMAFAIRKEALDILFFSNIVKEKSASFTLKEREQALEKVLSKVELVKTYFVLAKEQEWVSEKNFLILENEYDILKDSFSPEILKFKEVKKPIPIEIKREKVLVEAIAPREESNTEKEEKKEVKKLRDINYEELTPIQLKVLEILQEEGNIKSNQISSYFPEMNPRTIRRELKGLKDMKIVSTIGGGKATLYEINKTY
jgi:hypothetical protein